MNEQANGIAGKRARGACRNTESTRARVTHNSLGGGGRGGGGSWHNDMNTVFVRGPTCADNARGACVCPHMQTAGARRNEETGAAGSKQQMKGRGVKELELWSTAIKCHGGEWGRTKSA